MGGEPHQMAASSLRRNARLVNAATPRPLGAALGLFQILEIKDGALRAFIDAH
jgi:hypothetical protein